MKTFLSQLPGRLQKAKKRVGRGIGSGVGGHTSTRGQKGQKSRNHVGLLFMGTKVKKSLIQRLPALRGKNKFKSLRSKTMVITLKQLSALQPNSKVDLETLMKAKILQASILPKERVKVVSTGELTIPLTVAVPVTAAAKQKIEAAGGNVVLA